MLTVAQLELRKTGIGNFSVEARFWEKVVKTDGCWLWRGAIGKQWGYGQFRFEGRTQAASRVAWKLTHGKIEKGLCVLHRCDTPSCVRPDHLFLGTNQDNRTDCKNKGRANGAVGDANGSRLHPERRPRGERHFRRRFSDSEVVAAVAAYRSGERSSALAERMGVDITTIQRWVKHADR